MYEKSNEKEVLAQSWYIRLVRQTDRFQILIRRRQRTCLTTMSAFREQWPTRHSAHFEAIRNRTQGVNDSSLVHVSLAQSTGTLPVIRISLLYQPYNNGEHSPISQAQFGAACTNIRKCWRMHICSLQYKQNHFFFFSSSLAQSKISHSLFCTVLAVNTLQDNTVQQLRSMGAIPHVCMCTFGHSRFPNSAIS